MRFSEDPDVAFSGFASFGMFPSARTEIAILDWIPLVGGCVH